MIFGCELHLLHSSGMLPEDHRKHSIITKYSVNMDKKCHYRGERSPARALYLLLDYAETLYYKS